MPCLIMLLLCCIVACTSVDPIAEKEKMFAEYMGHSCSLLEQKRMQLKREKLRKNRIDTAKTARLSMLSNKASIAANIPAAAEISEGRIKVIEQAIAEKKCVSLDVK